MTLPAVNASHAKRVKTMTTSKEDKAKAEAKKAADKAEAEAKKAEAEAKKVGVVKNKTTEAIVKSRAVGNKGFHQIVDVKACKPVKITSSIVDKNTKTVVVNMNNNPRSVNFKIRTVKTVVDEVISPDGQALFITTLHPQGLVEVRLV